MYSVTYHRAASVTDAAKLLKNRDAKLLSGGMTLIPAVDPDRSTATMRTAG